MIGGTGWQVECRLEDLGVGYPKNIILLDNDCFGAPSWRDCVEELNTGSFRVNFNQGINARMISEEAATAIASLSYYDADFKRRRLYTAWDSLPDEGVLFRGLPLLEMPPHEEKR